MADGMRRRNFLKISTASAMVAAVGVPLPSVSAASDDDEWWSLGHDEANTGFVDRAGPTSDAARDWTFGAGASVRAPPIYADGDLYVGNIDGGFYGVSSGGNENWEAEIIGEPNGSPAYYDEKVFVNAGGLTYAFDADSGDELWSHSEGIDSVSGPTVSEELDTVYVSKSRAVFAFDADDGNVVWDFPLVGRFGTTPALYNEYLYVGDSGGQVYRIDEIDGSSDWEVSITGTRDEILGAPAVADGTVYVADTGGVVHALDTSDGSVIWSHDTGDSFDHSPAVDGDRVYVGGDRGGVYALDAGDGDEVWSVSASSVNGSVAVVGDAVYFSEGRTLRAVAAGDGSELWEYGANENMYSPIVVDDTVYAGSGDDRLHAVAGNVGFVGASIRVLSATLDTDRVGTNEDFTVTVELENEGGTSGEIRLELRTVEDGNLRASERVTVSGGDTITETLTASFVTEGERELEVTGEVDGEVVDTVSVGTVNVTDEDEDDEDDDDVADDGADDEDDETDDDTDDTDETADEDDETDDTDDEPAGFSVDVSSIALVAGVVGAVGAAGGVAAAYFYSKREREEAGADE